MTEKISATERLMNFIAYLFKNSNRYVTRDDIFNQVDGYAGEPVNDALFRLFERDKKKLKEIGITIKSIAEHIGEGNKPVYKIDVSESFIPPMYFTSEERLLLEALASTIPAQTAVGYYLRLALMKLRNEYIADDTDIEEYSDDDMGVASKQKQAPIVSQKRETAHESPLIREFLDAIALKKRVSFSYSRPNSNKLELREIAPYGMYHVNGFWYLVGFSFERDSIRVFKLERITGRIKTLTKSFDTPDKTELEKVKRQLLLREFGTINVRLEFKKEIGFLVEQEYGGIGEFSKTSEGNIIFDLKNSTKSVLWRILSDYQDFVRIDSPQSVITDVKNELMTIIEKAKIIDK